MSKGKHRFWIEISGLTSQVDPIYDGLTLSEEKPEGEVFFRSKLNQTITFSRSDFWYIQSQSLSTEMIFIIEEVDDAETFPEIYRGVFTKADCDFDEDNELVRVKPRPVDKYTLLMEGLNKEFNLIDLSPGLSPVQYKRRPILQAYVFDSQSVTNYTQGNYWEEPVQAGDVNALTLVSKYYFSLGSDFFYIPGDVSLTPDVSGRYSTFDGRREDNAYEIYTDGSKWIIRAVSGGAWVYQMGNGEDLYNVDNFLEPGGDFVSNLDGGVSKVNCFRVSVYLRYYTDKLNVDGVDTFPIPGDDIVADNKNYSRIIGLSADNASGHSGHQAGATPYGKFDTNALNFAGDYFTLYPGSGAPFLDGVFPLSKKDWRYFSLWFEFTPFQATIENNYSTDILLSDAYKLSEVISVYLAEIDPSLTFLEDSDHSEFFFGSNPIRTISTDVIISPKSNVLYSGYDQAARKAPLRFSEILQMLKDLYRVFWFVTENDEFRIEHLEWFENGGDYSTPQVSTDLTIDLEPKTQKKWSFRSNKYKYDLNGLDGRREFKWMDRQSGSFEGYPIDMMDDHVDKTLVTQIQLGKFSSDVDFIQASPGDISPDGFVIMEAVAISGGYILPQVSSTFEGVSLQVQNGYMTFIYLHNKYHKHQLPCENVRINDIEIMASSVIKIRVQEITVPLTSDPDGLQLITTDLGDGKPVERTRDLIHNIYKLTLKHDG